MKKLMLSTAILAALSTGALAQDAATSPLFRAEADPMALRASEFIGMRIYASETAIDVDEYAGVQQDWQDIGEINDVILSRDGTIDSVLVDIGGFLGMGERQVAVGLDAIRFVSDSATADETGDFFLVMNAARTDFEAAPEYSMGGADMTTDGTMDATGETDAAAAEAGTEGEVVADTPVTDEAEVATDGAADAQVNEDGTMMAEDGAMTGEGAMADDGTTTAEGTTAPDAMREPVMRDGYAAAAVEELTTDTLTGARVYDANDKWIGDISELVVTEDGQITDAIIDVGGFLGIGEKPVALKMTDMDILRSDGGDDVRIYLSMTEAQLKEMPAHGG